MTKFVKCKGWGAIFTKTQVSMDYMRFINNMMIDIDSIQFLQLDENPVWHQFYMTHVETFTLWVKIKCPRFTEDDIQMLYSDCIMELREQIMSKKNITCKPSTYLYSIAKNKLNEVIREANRNKLLRQGEDALIVRKRKKEIKQEAPADHPLQRPQEEEEGIAFSIEDMFKYRTMKKDEKTPELEKFEKARKKYVRKVIFSLPLEPCGRLLIETWYRNKTDMEIVEDSDGHYANVDSVKTQRYKCHQKLKPRLEKWYKSFRLNKIGYGNGYSII